MQDEFRRLSLAWGQGRSRGSRFELSGVKFPHQRECLEGEASFPSRTCLYQGESCTLVLSALRRDRAGKPQWAQRFQVPYGESWPCRQRFVKQKLCSRPSNCQLRRLMIGFVRVEMQSDRGCSRLRKEHSGQERHRRWLHPDILQHLG
jgi:hypothetical protein